MKLPNRKDIREAYAYSVFLRGAGPLKPADRMLCDLGIEIQALRSWIRDEGERNNTCTHDILGGEICQGCKCGKNQPTTT